MIAETGYWTFSDELFQYEHCWDSGISHSIVSLAKEYSAKKVYDFGCGSGQYVAHLNDNGINASGFDGNPITSTIPNCKVQDLTTKFQLDPVDFLVCLEVCEHVPKEYETDLLENINRHLNIGGILILSWAVEGQGGLGHVNCKNNDYVVEKLHTMGYSYLESISQSFRNSVTIAYWFRTTIMIFKKN